MNEVSITSMSPRVRRELIAAQLTCGLLAAGAREDVKGAVQLYAAVLQELRQLPSPKGE